MRSATFFARLSQSRTRIQARQYTRDSDGQFASTGVAGGDDEDDGAPLVEPSVMASTKVDSDLHVRAIDDPDGLAVYNSDGGRYVEIIGSSRDPAGEGILYSPADARAIADGIDGAAQAARSASIPTDSSAYDNGPVTLGRSLSGGYEIVTFHDGNGDLFGEGTTGVAVAHNKGESVEWDSPDATTVDLKLASSFSAALRDMADAAGG